MTNEEFKKVGENIKEIREMSDLAVIFYGNGDRFGELKPERLAALENKWAGSDTRAMVFSYIDELVKRLEILSSGPAPRKGDWD